MVDIPHYLIYFLRYPDLHRIPLPNMELTYSTFLNSQISLDSLYSFNYLDFYHIFFQYHGRVINDRQGIKLQN